MKAKQIMIGCGIAAFLAIAIFAVVAYFGATAFFAFGVGTDLSDYRDAVRGMDIDAVTRDRLLDDFESVRLSLDEGNNFGFFQWLEIDDSIQGILADGKIDADEHDSLQAEIARMKKIQGIVDD